MTKRRYGWPLALLLAWAVLYPMALVFLESFKSTGGWTLAHYAEFASRVTEWRALWNSIWISALSVVCSALVGVPLAFVFERLDFPGRRLLGALVALPAVLPPLVGVIAFSFLYGESGFAGRLVAALLGRDTAPWRLAGAGAILLVHSYSMFVYFYLFTRAGLARMDRSLIEAAESLGASRVRILATVTLPLLRPQIASAALLVFMTSLGSFSAPYIFGGGFRVMTTQIVNSKLNGNDAASLVETAALAIVAIAALGLLRRLQGSRSVAAVGKGSRATVAVHQPLLRWTATALGWSLAIFLLLPHLTLLLVSLVPLGAWGATILPQAFTIENYLALVNEPERFRPLANSLWMGTAATVGAILVGLWAGRETVQRRVRLAGAIEQFVNLPWAIPGTVLAIALATMFSVREPLAARWILIGTSVILPLAYFVRNIPIAAGSILAGFRQLDPALDEAAVSLGAGRMRIIWRITAPLLRPAILAGGALAFATAVGDFVTSVVLYTYETRPISIEILSALRQYDIGIAAAYGVIVMAISALAMSLGTRR